MIHALRKLYEPEFYQGSTRLSRYFEGWYYKVVSEDRAFALIPGVSRNPSDPHAFIQFIDGIAGVSSYHRLPISEFSYATDEFSIAIGESRFSLHEMFVRLESVTADLRISEATLWRGSGLQPGTMGWYSFVPFMQCNHGIIVMDAGVEGTVDGKRLEGRFYMEKDYGRSFPNAWIWLQTNGFARRGVSLTCSIANVPFVGGAFTGFLAGLSVAGELFKFTTYTGSRIEQIDADEAVVELVMSDRHRRLSIRAKREPGAELRAPELGEMRGRVVETIQSSVEVELVVDSEVVFRGTGASAGLEVVNPDLLLPRRR